MWCLFLVGIYKWGKRIVVSDIRNTGREIYIYILHYLLSVYIYIYIYKERERERQREKDKERIQLRCSRSCRRKWAPTKLFTFCITLPLENIIIQLFSLHLWVNSRADWFFNLGMAKENSGFKPIKPLVSHPTCAKGLLKVEKKITWNQIHLHANSCQIIYIYIYTWMFYMSVETKLLALCFKPSLTTSPFPQCSKFSVISHVYCFSIVLETILMANAVEKLIFDIEWNVTAKCKWGISNGHILS